MESPFLHDEIFHLIFHRGLQKTSELEDEARSIKWLGIN